MHVTDIGGHGQACGLLLVGYYAPTPHLSLTTVKLSLYLAITPCCISLDMVCLYLNQLCFRSDV